MREMKAALDPETIDDLPMQTKIVSIVHEPQVRINYLSAE